MTAQTAAAGAHQRCRISNYFIRIPAAVELHTVELAAAHGEQILMGHREYGSAAQAHNAPPAAQHRTKPVEPPL